MKVSEKVLCAFCRIPHRIYHKKDIGVLDTLVLFGITGIFSFLVWGYANNRSLILFGCLTVLLQSFCRIRWRQSVRCPQCGFDPVLYKRQPDVAAEAVKTFLAKRKTDPKFLLKPKPQLNPVVHKTDGWKVNLPAVKPPEVPVGSTTDRSMAERD